MGDNLDEKKEGQAPNLDNPTNDGGDEVAKIERYKQQIEGSRQEALTQRQERISDWQEILSEDVSNLKRLAKVTDTKLVNEVLSKFNFDSLDEALAEYGYLDKKPVNSNGMTKEELEQWYEDRKAKDIHQIAIQEANKAFSDLTEDEKNLALKNFEKITKGKTLTIDEAKEYADMAAIYAIKDKVVKKGDKGQGLVNLAGIGSGNGGLNKGGKDSLDSIIDNW